uniref:Capsid protein n=1 Tax=Hubei levi-like virus 10 TaxID=1922909 RepID=A0A1L3KIK6_9VIRU|nr:hypothetical protein [Hubei levi-like virus 10]
MPQLAARVLKDAQNVDHTFNPASKNGNVVVFVDRSQAAFANQSTLREEITPTTSANQGHRLNAALTIPSPILDADGCCVDKSTPPVSFIQVRTLASKFASSSELDNLIAEFRSYVASEVFADLVKGGNNW